MRFALERYDRGDVKTNAVVELLDRLKREIGSLRDILKGTRRENGHAPAWTWNPTPISWTGNSGRACRKSKSARCCFRPEAWAVPPRNVRQYVEEVMGSGDTASARSILDNYAKCVHSDDLDARRKASAGLSEMADLFSKANHSLLKSTLHQWARP